MTQKTKTTLKEEIGKLLISFGKIMFGCLIFAAVLGPERAAKLTGGTPPENYISLSIMIPGVIAGVIFLVSGIILKTKNQEEKED